MSDKIHIVITDDHPIVCSLYRFILLGEQSLRTAMRSFIVHYHAERHQGLANRLVQPEPTHVGSTGAIQRRERLGGMLNSADCAAAWNSKHLVFQVICHSLPNSLIKALHRTG